MNNKQLQLAFKLIGVYILFTLALIFTYIVTQLFNAGGGDWGDSAYSGKPDLLLHDEIRTNYLTGFFAAALVAGELYWVARLTHGQPKQSRRIILAVMLILSLLLVAKNGPTVFMPIDVGQ